MPRYVSKLAAPLLAASGAAFGGNLVLNDVTIVDVERGVLIGEQTVLISEGRIVSIGSRGSISGQVDAKVVEAAGRYLMPALWDMHIHPGRVEDLALLVANGVGGARIMWGQPQHLAWRARIELGELVGPRLLISGPIVEGLPPPKLADVVDTEGRHLVNTAADGAAEVRRQRAAGFDYIKVYNNVPREAYLGLAAEAERLNIPVVGHVPFQVGLKGVLAARQSSVEHLRGFAELLVPPDAAIQPGIDLRSRTLSWQYADLSRVPKLVRAVRAAGSWQTPTLSTRIYYAPPDELTRYLAMPEAEYLTGWSRSILQNRQEVKWLSNFSEEDFIIASRGHENQNALVRALRRADVRLLAGTDTMPWGFSLHGELERLVEAGLTPRETLEAATSNPARYARLEKTSGRVGVGYSADVVLLDENPLLDIRNTRRIHAVVRQGKLFDRAALDELLANVKAQYVGGAPAPRTQ